MNAVTKRACWTAAALALLASGSLFAQSALTPEQLTLRVERLTELSQRSEAKLSAAQSQLKEISEQMDRMGRMVDNPAVLEMIQQVDQIAEDIGLLRGEIEVQGHDLGEIKKRQRELYQDIDRRLRDLENRPVSQAPAAQISVPQVTAPALAAAASTETPSLAPAAPTTPAAAPSPTEEQERVAYQAAFDTLKEGRYKEAKVELRAFLDKYPNSSYAGNAQYWLGEAHYVTRNFEQGIVEFENVLNTYPGSNKVPDAMLKLGYTFYELKQYPQSKAILQDLSERFPNETAARLANKRLDRIRKEGH